MKKIGHMLKPLLSKFCPDLSSRSKGVSEKQVLAKLKPLVVEVLINQVSKETSHPLNDKLN